MNCSTNRSVSGDRKTPSYSVSVTAEIWKHTDLLVEQFIASLMLPPGIKKSDWSMPFMLRDAVTLFDLLGYFIGNIFPFQIVVYHLVAEVEFIFINLTRIHIKQVGRRRFGRDPLIRTKKTQ